MNIHIVGYLLALILCVSGKDDDDYEPPDTRTVIDILSSSAQFSIFLHHLQRTGLIPTLNTARNISLFAPVNSAFHNVPDDILSEHLFLYHIINGTISSDQIISDSVYLTYLPNKDAKEQNTPIIISKEESGLVVNKHFPVAESDQYAGPGRGVVHSVSSLIRPPVEGFCSSVADLQNCQQFIRLFQIENSCDDKDWPELMTFFIPSDNAFNVFDEIELNYLSSVRASEDRKLIIDRHFIPHLLLPQFLSSNGSNVTLANGISTTINSEYIVNFNNTPVQSNILSTQGLIFVYDQFILIKKEHGNARNFVTITPEKYLYGLGYDNFVREIHFAGLQSLVNASALHLAQTIFLPTGAISDDVEIAADPFHSPELLSYHFVDGTVSLSDMMDKHLTGSLLSSKYHPGRMHHYPQKIKLKRGRRDFQRWFINGHRIVSDEYRIGNTSIYLIDGDLDAPPSLSLALGPFFQSSYSVEFLDKVGLLDHHPNNKGWTYLLPSRVAWESQSLIMHFMQTSDEAVLYLFGSLIFETPLYAEDFNSRTVRMLNGDTVDVKAVYDKHSKTTSICVNDTSLTVGAENILFEAGVAHSIEELVLPEDLKITASDLIAAGDRSYFIRLLEQRNLSSVLDNDKKFTILVPSEKSLQKDNITVFSDNIDLVLSMHILPGNPAKDLFSGADNAKTLADKVQLSGRNVSDRLFFISVSDGIGAEAYVSDIGSTNGYENQTTVLFLDRYISPNWVKTPFIPPFHLKTHVAMLIGAAATIIIMFMVISGVFYGIVNGSKDKGERRPLLADVERSNSNDTNGYGSSSSSNPEEEIPTRPIRTTKVEPEREFGRHLGLPDR